MKNILTPLWVTFLCLQSFVCSAQLQEDFSDGNFSQDPAWFCSDSTDWSVNASGQLQSERTVPNSSSWISTTHQRADSVQWELDVQLLFNPSSLNYMDIYLTCSDSVPVSSAATGYFVRIGNTDDEIALYRKDAGNRITKLIDGVNGLLNGSDNRYRIKVTRRKSGQWRLWYDANMTGNEYVNGGSAVDSTYRASRFFSIFLQQSTAGFFQKHRIDNIHIQPYQPDRSAPCVIRQELFHPNRLQLQFNEEMAEAGVLHTGNYFVNNGIGQPEQVEKDRLDVHAYILSFDTSLVSGNKYELRIRNMTDTEGNPIADTLIPLFYYTPQPGDIVINELLFNPTTGGSDYIEIMNRSPYPVNLKGFSVDQISSTGLSVNKKLLCTTDLEIPPGALLVFTADAHDILSSYFVSCPACLLELSSLPSMPDDKGHIRLLDAAGSVMDALHYEEDWHFPLLNQKEGVALERIDPDGPTQHKDNWNSASRTSGYGTPTGPNSQRLVKKESLLMISLSAPVFSPDQDGNEDVLFVQYVFPEGGYMLNCIVFDIMGQPVRTLQKNMLCGVSGRFKWDGLDEQDRVLPAGHYILFTEVFNLKGVVKRIRREVVLARRR